MQNQPLQNRNMRSILNIPTTNTRLHSTSDLHNTLHGNNLDTRRKIRYYSIIYNILHDSTALPYLKDLPIDDKKTYTSDRTTRSQSRNLGLLYIPRTHNKTADNAFSITGRGLRNTLPENESNASDYKIFLENLFFYTQFNSFEVL